MPITGLWQSSMLQKVRHIIQRFTFDANTISSVLYNGFGLSDRNFFEYGATGTFHIIFSTQEIYSVEVPQSSSFHFSCLFHVLFCKMLRVIFLVPLFINAPTESIKHSSSSPQLMPEFQNIPVQIKSSTSMPVPIVTILPASTPCFTTPCLQNKYYGNKSQAFALYKWRNSSGDGIFRMSDPHCNKAFQLSGF